MGEEEAVRKMGCELNNGSIPILRLFTSDFQCLIRKSPSNIKIHGEIYIF